MKVTLIMAVTVDGIIAHNHFHLPTWTCRSDKQMFKWLTQKAGVVVLGSKTHDTIGKSLAGRLNVVLTRHPERYQACENLVFWNESPHNVLKKLETKGYEEVILAGGAIINTLFLQARLIDDILLTISPKIFGNGLSLFDKPCELDLELLEINKLEINTLLLHYRIIYP